MRALAGLVAYCVLALACGSLDPTAAAQPEQSRGNAGGQLPPVQGSGSADAGSIPQSDGGMRPTQPAYAMVELTEAVGVASRR